MGMGRYPRAAAIILVGVLLAGCTALGGDDGGGGDTATDSQATQTPNDGLMIDFRPVSRSIDENEVLQFDVSVQNTGEQKATIRSLNVFGSPFLDIGRRCQKMERIAEGTVLNAGSSEAFAWKCSAPLGSGSDTALVDLEAGATDTFPAGMEVVYSYRTTARTSMSIATPSRIQGQSAVQTDNTAAPVHAEVNLKSPQSAPKRGKLRIPVTVRNVGDGRVKDGAVGVTVSVDGNEKSKTVQLVDGSRQQMFTLGGFNLGDNLKTTVDITVTLEYTYTERTSSEFTIRGQPAGITVENFSEAVTPEEVAAAETPPLQFAVSSTDLTRQDYNLTVRQRPDIRLNTSFTIWVNEDGQPEDGRSVDCGSQVNPGKGDFTCEFAVGGEGKQYPDGTEFKAAVRSHSGEVYEEAGQIDLGERSEYRGDDEVIGIWTEPRNWSDRNDSGTTDNLTVFRANISRKEYRKQVTQANFSSRDPSTQFAGTCRMAVAMEAGEETTSVESGSGVQTVAGGDYLAGNESPVIRAADYSCGSVDVSCIPTPLAADFTNGRFSAEPTCYREPLTVRARVQAGGGETSHGAVVLRNGSHTHMAERDMPADVAFPFDAGNGTVSIGDAVTFSSEELYGCDEPDISLPLRVKKDAWKQMGREDVDTIKKTKKVRCSDPAVDVSVSSGPPVPYGKQFELAAAVRHIQRDITWVNITQLTATASGQSDKEFSGAACDASDAGSPSPCTVQVDIPPDYSGGTLQYTVVAMDAQRTRVSEQDTFNIQ